MHDELRPVSATGLGFRVEGRSYPGGADPLTNPNIIVSPLHSRDIELDNAAQSGAKLTPGQFKVDAQSRPVQARSRAHMFWVHDRIFRRIVANLYIAQPIRIAFVTGTVPCPTPAPLARRETSRKLRRSEDRRNEEGEKKVNKSPLYST